jgi:mannose-6-phosphate isomerase-like protein (cupin superfamily)
VSGELSVHPPGAAPPFPGGVGISGLRVYPWQTDDGLHGGTPHLHLCCSECYVVVGGAGRLQTLSGSGFAEWTLRPGDVAWFTPGTIHRAVNDGDLQVVVVMQNGGLPEAGDAVLTLPPEHLTDPETYRAAVSLDGDGPARARARRDLALTGFAALREDPAALAEFHRAAAGLVAPRLAEWAGLVERGALAIARETAEQVAALARGDISHLSR